MSTEQLCLEAVYSDILNDTEDRERPLAEKFTQYVLRVLETQNEIASGWEINSLVIRGKGFGDARVDAYLLSPGGTLDLFVTVLQNVNMLKPGLRTFTTENLKSSRKLASTFLTYCLNRVHEKLIQQDPAQPLAERIWLSRESIVSVKIWIVTDGLLSTRESIRNLLQDEVVPELSDVAVSFRVVDIGELRTLQSSHYSAIDVDLSSYMSDLPVCISTRSDQAQTHSTHAVFLEAVPLARLYQDLGNRLLERNVRAFLQTKNKVNKGIQQTLAEQPDRFLAYNNGLCCTASKVIIVSEGGVSRLSRIKDFQIVNGGQTTASLFHAWKKEKRDLSLVKVLVKITEMPEPEMLSEMVPEIARNANSQSKVSLADLAANGDYHRNLELKARTTPVSPKSGQTASTYWYYERAKGSYVDEKLWQASPAERQAWERKFPQSQKFTKTDLAKYEHAWWGYPHLVCLGAEKNFAKFAEELESRVPGVVDDAWYKGIVAKAILWRSTEKIFDGLNLRGYRANSIAYGIAVVGEATQRRLDLMDIWTRQKISQELSLVLQEACRRAHGFIAHAVGNQNEYSKKVGSWEEFRHVALPIGNLRLVDTPQGVPVTSADPEEHRWDLIRKHFADKTDTPIGQILGVLNRKWKKGGAIRRVSDLAKLSWPELKHDVSKKYAVALVGLLEEAKESGM